MINSVTEYNGLKIEEINMNESSQLVSWSREHQPGPGIWGNFNRRKGSPDKEKSHCKGRELGMGLSGKRVRKPV